MPSVCRELSGDLAPLASLTSLQSLDLSVCRQLSDLTPLAGLTSLQMLRLDGCLGVRRFAPLESLLPTLNELSLFGFRSGTFVKSNAPPRSGTRWRLLT
jgi:internalin A